MSGKDRSNEVKQRWDPTRAEDSDTQAFIRRYLKLADITLGVRAKYGPRRQQVKAERFGGTKHKKAA